MIALLPNDPMTPRRVDSVACLIEWARSMAECDRERFFAALACSSASADEEVMRQVRAAQDKAASASQREQALQALADALSSDAGSEISSPPNAGRTMQSEFADRLQRIMEAKRISQQELAARVGCSQPAISQMITRQARPQKKTILKLAHALNCEPCDLWPRIEVVELLDATAEFQEGYDMTEAEAQALKSPSLFNRSRIDPKRLPTRRRS